MPENEPNPIDQPNEADAASEAEVDRILGEAAGLADDLEGEVGDARSPAGGAADRVAAVEEDNEVDVDTQLDHVERLLKGLGSEEDPQQERSMDEGPTEPADDEVQSVGYEARKFEESTKDRSPACGVAFEDERPAKTQTGPIGAAPVGSPRSKVEPRTLAATSQPREDESAAPCEGDGLDGSVRGAPPRFAWLGKVASAARRFCFSGIDRLLRTIDGLDAAFAFVSYDIRRLIGLVALALLVAAFSIMAFSFS